MLTDYTLKYNQIDSVSCVNTDKSTYLIIQVDLSVLTHDTLEKVKVSPVYHVLTQTS